MPRHFYYFAFLLFIVTACSAPGDGLTVEDAEPLMSALKNTHAPDSRTDRVDLYWQNGVLHGYTTSPAAKADLDTRAAKDGFEHRVRLLPDTAVGDSISSRWVRRSDNFSPERSPV